MKLFRYTLVILFILAYAFIVSGCASKQYIYGDFVLKCEPDLTHNYIIKNELEHVVIENMMCFAYKSIIEIKELK